MAPGLSCRHMPSRRAFHFIMAVTTALGLGGCSADTDDHVAQRPAAEGDPDWFVDRAQATGLEFVHFNGMSGSFYQPEIMAPGVGLFDYDNDGDLDAYLVQGQMLGTGKTFSQAVLPPKEPLPLRGRLYRNDLDIAAARYGSPTSPIGAVSTRAGMAWASLREITTTTGAWICT